MIVERKIDGLLQLVGGKFHQLAGGQCDGRQAEHRNIPAAAADVDAEGVGQPAVDLIGKSDRGDEFPGACPLGLRDGETGRDIVARMTGNAADISVIQVEIAEGGAIGEGCKVGRGAPLGADDGRAAAAARQHDVAANAYWLLVEGREAAAERVDKMHFDPFDGRVIEIVIAQAIGISGEPLREGWLVRLRSHRRPIFRLRSSPRKREHAGTGGQMQKSSTREFHCNLSQ
jgi:hypothetical protein